MIGAFPVLSLTVNNACICSMIVDEIVEAAMFKRTSELKIVTVGQQDSLPD